MCMPLCTIPMEAVRGGPQVVDKNHRAKISRLLVAIDQPFREQSVTPRQNEKPPPDCRPMSSPSEQSLPGAHSDTPRPSLRATTHRRLVGWHVGGGNAKHLLVLAGMITEDGT